MLERQAAILEGELELCYVPFSMADGLRASLQEPPATLLVLPNGWVKVAAALPQVCADLRRDSLQQAWKAYCSAWRDEALIAEVRQRGRRRSPPRGSEHLAVDVDGRV